MNKKLFIYRFVSSPGLLALIVGVKGLIIAHPESPLYLLYVGLTLISIGLFYYSFRNDSSYYLKRYEISENEVILSYAIGKPNGDTKQLHIELSKITELKKSWNEFLIGSISLKYKDSQGLYHKPHFKSIDIALTKNLYNEINKD